MTLYLTSMAATFAAILVVVAETPVDIIAVTVDSVADGFYLFEPFTVVSFVQINV